MEELSTPRASRAVIFLSATVVPLGGAPFAPHVSSDRPPFDAHTNQDHHCSDRTRSWPPPHVEGPCMRIALSVSVVALLGALVWLSRTESGAAPSGLGPEAAPRAVEAPAPSGVELDPEEVRSAVGAMVEESRSEESLEAVVEYGQFAGQVLQADGTPCSGGAVGFLRGEYGLGTQIYKFPVSKDGYYSTGKIPLTPLDLGAIQSPDRPLESGAYTPLYRTTSRQGWEVLEDLYSGSSGVMVPVNGVRAQDFILREGFTVSGQVQVDLDFLGDDSANLSCPITVSRRSARADIVAVGTAKMYGADNTRRIKLRRPRYNGDTKEVIESGDFSFRGVEPGEYVLRLSILVGPSAEQRSLIHIARGFRVVDEDVIFEPEVVEWDEFSPFDSPSVPQLLAATQ